MSYDTALNALADATRRGIFEWLRFGERSVGEIAEHIGVSQPAVSQHLRVLREARLVSHRNEGAKRFYSVTPSGLEELRRWIESMWDDVLAAYARQPD